MSYSNHNLRTDLQEWKNRLYRATFNQFGFQVKFFLNKINSTPKILGILEEAAREYPIGKDEMPKYVEDIMGGNRIEFENEANHAGFCFQFLDYYTETYNTYDLHNYITFRRGDFQKTKDNIIEGFFSPMIYYLHDKLDKSSSVLYLLEKYKRRVEWFTKSELFIKYKDAGKEYEQVLEDDLRLFLFDQGIEYPFSTPSSSSGRADLVGEIETDDPLVVEVKIFDRSKNYRKDRIISGFTQILKYVNDYNKDVGYLVIFNADSAELNFKLSDEDQFFPPSLIFNNRTFYFIVINFGVFDSASKSGKTEEIIISTQDLKSQTSANT